jgi:hypothetical protein
MIMPNYDFQDELLGFQHLKNSATIIEKIYMFAINAILLYDAIPSCELDELSNELEWLDTNVNEYKWNPTMKGPKLSMFG